MSGFPTIQLGEVTTKVGSGSTPRGGEAAYKKSGTPLIRSMNVHFGGFREDGLAYIDDDQAAALQNVEVRARDVLLNITGASIGRVTIAPPHMDGARVNQHVCIIRPDDRLEPSFLRWFLASPYQQRLINSMESGATRQALTKEKILAFGVPLPSLDGQREIVAEIEKQFSRLDEAVANLQRVKANLKRYKASVLKAAVEGRLVETEAALASREGRTFETGEQFLRRILEERRAMWAGRGSFSAEPPSESLEFVPDGWAVASLDQLSAVVRGGSPRPAGDPRYFGGSVPWITVGSITADETDYLRHANGGLTEEGKERSRFIKEHTLLLTNSGATLGVPKISLIAGCINDGVAALLDVEYPLKHYLVHYLRTKTDALRQVNQGAAQPNLNTTIIKAMVVPLPPVAEQARILSEVDRHLSIIREVETEVDTNLQRAQALRQSVLQRAFSGEMTVKGVGESTTAVPEVKSAGRLQQLEPVSVVMAARIIAANCGEATFGRVGLQKRLHLATYIGQIATNDEYARRQAGPLDMSMLHGAIRRLNELGWFRETERADKLHGGKAYSYSALINADGYKQHLSVLTPDQNKVIDDLNQLMRTWSTEQCELFSTVYAAWNDLILWKRNPTAQAVADQVHNHWHESKKKFSFEKIAEMMRKITGWGYAPVGFGRPTIGATADTTSGELFE